MLNLAPSAHLFYFFKGLKEAFNWQHVIHLVTTSKTVQQTLLKSLILNGVAYLGLLAIVETFYNTPDHHLFGYSYTDLTGYPLYLMCLLLNSKFYSTIAAQHTNIQSQQHDGNTMIGSANTIILYGNFALFIAMIRWIPYIGTVISFFIYCIIMAYYCFEYKWINQDWTIEQRMSYAEQHWAYCLGYGLPATTITFFLSTLKAGSVFALIYPSYIMMASVATPEPASTQQGDIPFTQEFGLPFRVPVFFGVRLMNGFIIQTICTLGGSRAETFVTEKRKDNLGKLV